MKKLASSSIILALVAAVISCYSFWQASGFKQIVLRNGPNRFPEDLIVNVRDLSRGEMRVLVPPFVMIWTKSDPIVEIQTETSQRLDFKYGYYPVGGLIIELKEHSKTPDEVAGVKALQKRLLIADSWVTKAKISGTVAGLFALGWGVALRKRRSISAAA